MKTKIERRKNCRSLPTPLRPRRRTARFFLGALLLFSFASISASWGENYHGKVVDAETGEPLKEAVVVVYWLKKAVYSMNGPEYFHNARETLTDAEGNFSMDASEGINWNPLTWVGPPRIVVWQPGYWPLSDAYPREFRDLYGLEEALLKGAIIRLPKLKTKEELRKFSGESPFVIGLVPKDKVPNLFRLANVQREMAGLKPIPEWQ